MAPGLRPNSVAIAATVSPVSMTAPELEIVVLGPRGISVAVALPKRADVVALGGRRGPRRLELRRSLGKLAQGLARGLGCSAEFRILLHRLGVNPQRPLVEAEQVQPRQRP